MPDSPLLLVYLDRYHLGDPLFLQRFAPTVKAHEGPLVLLHGAGEAAERALEAEGRIAERVDGVLVIETEAERALVERAARERNRRIVHDLNDAGVSALRLTGTDRGLLRQEAGDGVTVGRTAWLRPLVRQGVVPVVALLATGAEGHAVEAPPGAALAALARALGAEGEAPVVVLLTEAREHTGEGASLPAQLEADVGRGVLAEGVRVRLVHPTALRGVGLPAGSDLPAEKP